MAVARLLPFLLLATVPFAFGSYSGYQFGLLLIYAIAAQGIALAWGKAGFLPLGQALFFGMGAYLAGFAMKTADGWLLLAPLLLLSIAVPALLACLIGFLVFERRAGSGPYFSLITLAMSMLGFQLANSLDWLTGGFNGMTGIPGLPGVDSYEYLYFVIVAVLGLTSLLLAHIFRSPFGVMLDAIRQNEERLHYLGYRTSVLKALAFAISAGLAGLAGALFAAHQGIVTPQAVGFVLSAELVIWTAVGGRASIAGPVLGAVLIGYISAELRDSFAYWEIVVALIFIIVVLKFPYGLAGMLASLAGRLGWRSRPETPQRDLPVAPRVQPSTAALAFGDVSLRLGGVQILNGLEVRPAGKGIHCLIGPNGAGKTTAFNVITGRFRPNSGSVSWNGIQIGGRQPFEIARLGIGRKFQVPSVFPESTVGDNLSIALWAGRVSLPQLFGRDPFRWSTPLLTRMEALFPFLRDGAQTASALSLGERQMLEFSMAYLAEPRLILLDEPCAGLSTAETAHMIEAIAALHAETGTAVLIIEHDMQVVERLADFVHVLHLGALLAEGTVAEIKASDTVRAVYTGGSK